MTTAIAERVNELIVRGQRDVENGLTEIKREFDIREDLIVRPTALKFNVAEKGIIPYIPGDYREGAGQTFELTDYARGQLLDKCGVPQTFADRLLKLGEYGLLKTNLTELLPRVSPDGLLIRHIGGLAKGILSTSYRRMDASPVFAAFCESCVAQGYVPFRARNTESRYTITFVHPEIHEITGQNGYVEVVLYGAQITSSDYGRGALSINIVILRIRCANLAVATDILRKVHLGKRWEGSEDVAVLSKKTIALDNRTVASAVRDLVTSGVLGQAKALSTQISHAMGTEVSLTRALEQLKKQGLRKELLDSVKSTYEADLPVEVLPPGNNAWRLSNTLSLLANQSKGDEALDLQNAAYSVLPKKLAA